MDEWENVSVEDVVLEGMQDPFQNQFSQTIESYGKTSAYAKSFNTWTLKQFIVKANDDVR